MSYKTAAGQTYYLQASVSSTVTSVTLSSFTLAVSGTPITMAVLGTAIAYATIGPKTSSRELISFTGVTQNDDGTATLTGVTRGLSPVSPYASSSTYKLPHSGQSILILSDAPMVFNEYAALRNDNTYAGLNIYQQAPQSEVDPIDNADLTRKSWVTALVLGTLTTIDVIVPGTAGETIIAGQLIYLNTATNRWNLCDADSPSTVNNVLLGVAQGAGTNGNSITNGILLQGVDTHQSGLTAGNVYYASNTAGGISNTPGTTEVTIGAAKSTTELYFAPRFNQQITENQQDLLEALEAGTDFYGASVVGTDAYAVTPSPAVTAYANGMRIRFKADVANTGPATLAVSGLSAIAIKKNFNQDLVTGDILANQIVEVIYNSTGPVFEMNSQTAASSSVDIQTFSADGTWTKPTGAKTVYVECVGGGAGGGGGSSAPQNNFRQGGTGGGGGAFARGWFKASDLGSTVAVTVAVAAAGGTGGTGSGGGGVDGSNGTAGNPSSFGSNLTAYGGGAGIGGLQNSGDQTDRSGGGGGGTGGVGQIGQAGASSLGGSPAITAGVGGQGGSGGGGTITAAKGAEYGGGSGGNNSDALSTGPGGASIFGAGGGGGGGGMNNSNTYIASSAGGGVQLAGTGGGGAAGANGGTAGTAGAAGDSTKCGTGGGGGGANTTGAGAGGTGGAGGAPGGGGGGGGATTSTAGGGTGGSGGAGARGEVRVYTYF